MFLIKNGLKEGEALTSLLVNFTSEYAMRKVKANHKLLQFNGTHQGIISTDYVNLWGQTIHTVCFVSPL